jgi:hypothetical protein
MMIDALGLFAPEGRNVYRLGINTIKRSLGAQRSKGDLRPTRIGPNGAREFAVGMYFL